MHRAPAVGFLITRSRWHLRVLVFLWSLGFTVSLVLFLNQPEPISRTLALACLLAAGIVALRGWQKSPGGRLQWDGQHWHWSGLEAMPLCRLHLQLDFQTVILVCLHGEARQRIWLWLERPMPVDMQWTALRRAAVASQRSSRAHDRANASPAIGDDL